MNSFVGAFYDAVILYAHALNETIEAGGNVSDGINITRRMWNRTFEGRSTTGICYLLVQPKLPRDRDKDWGGGGVGRELREGLETGDV